MAITGVSDLTADMMDWLWHYFVWLHADPFRFWAQAWLVFTLVCWLAWRAPGDQAVMATRLSRFWFCLVIIATLAAFRWPSWFIPEEFNPDESQVIAGALTLDYFPVYWRHVDGTTHGPLCEYPLLFAAWAGAPFNYVTARVVAVLMQALSLICVWGTLRHLTTERIARFAVLPGLAFWSFVTWHDFVHYSTELPAILAISLAGWALVAALQRPAGDRRGAALLYVAGFCLGSVPFTKLQAMPIALCLTVIALALAWWTSAPSRRNRVVRLAWLILGGLSPFLVVASLLWLRGEWPAFWHAYILANLGYTGLGHHPFWEMPSWFFNFSTTSFAFAWFMAGSLASVLLYSRTRDQRQKRLQLAIISAWLLFASAYYAVISPSREVAHYLHLLVIPLTTLAGLLLASATADRHAALSRLPHPALFGSSYWH